MSAREAILGRLKAWPRQEMPRAQPSRQPQDPLQRFAERMTAVKGEVAVCADAREVPAVVADWLREAGARQLMTGLDPRLDALLEELAPSFDCLRFGQDFETLSDLLFESVDAGISYCEAGVAESGSLVIASSPDQPRTLSLVPPLHVALLPRQRLLDDLPDLFAEWRDQPVPPNRILISGPSKSADIEQVLAYGVHGPKRLLAVVFG